MQALVALLGELRLVYVALAEVLLFVVLVVVNGWLPPSWEHTRVP